MVQRSLDDNVKRVLAECAGERVVLLAPFMRAKPSVLRDELPRVRLRGFQRVRLNGEIKNLDEPKLTFSTFVLSSKEALTRYLRGIKRRLRPQTIRQRL